LKPRAWFSALRAHFLTATAAPVLVGTAVAWYAAGSFDLPNFLLAFVGGILIQLGANMSNDYFDFVSETDSKNRSFSAYSGGSRVIQKGLIPALQVLIAAIACFAVGSGIGVLLVVKLRSIPLLAIGLLGVFCAYFYTATPLRLGYRGFAELLNGVSFGPIVVLGAYAVQAPLWSATAFLASIPPGLLLAVVLMINEFPDFDSDRTVGKKTIVVLLGKRTALTVYHAAMLIPFLWVPAFVIAGIFPPWTLLALLSLPFAWRAFRISRKHFMDNSKIVGANMNTFLLHLAFNLLLALGFFLG
jgi:1,4-dihydroxy-2-naphthoate octaprenyltransferase